MALYQRDLIGSIDSSINSVASSVNSGIDSVFGITTTTASEKATTTGNVESTSSSAQSTASTKASSTLISTASASTAASSTNFSTITSSSSVASRTSSSSSPVSTSSSSSTSSTLATSTTSTSTPANPIALPSASSTSLPAAGNQVSAAGIAVAAIFATLVVLAIAYLLWKYLPACRRYRERKYDHGKDLSDDEEQDMHLDDPKQGLGLRKFSFHTSPTYYPGQPTYYPSQRQPDISQRPLTSTSEEHIVSPISTRSMESMSQHTLPSALTSGPTSYIPYRNVSERESAIGVALGSPMREKGLPPLPLPLPLPSTGYGRAFS